MWLFLFQKYIQYVISLKEISNPYTEKSALSKELIFGKLYGIIVLWYYRKNGPVRS